MQRYLNRHCWEPLRRCERRFPVIIFVVFIFTLCNYFYFFDARRDLGPKTFSQEDARPVLAEVQINEIADVEDNAVALSTNDQESWLLPPEYGPYNLSKPDEIKNQAQHPETVESIRQLLLQNGVNKGFFVECGALDGEYLSNTLNLEVNHGWTGLLVEAHPVTFAQLVQKKRKAWKSNVCLGKENNKVTFQIHTKYPELSKMKNTGLGSWAKSDYNEVLVDCVPLHKLLKEIDVTEVDFFSLDVEGAEMEVLKTIDFSAVKFKVLMIESNMVPGGASALTQFLAEWGYIPARGSVYENNKLDSVFINRNLNSDL